MRWTRKKSKEIGLVRLAVLISLLLNVKNILLSLCIRLAFSMSSILWQSFLWAICKQILGIIPLSFFYCLFFLLGVFGQFGPFLITWKAILLNIFNLTAFPLCYYQPCSLLSFIPVFLLGLCSFILCVFWMLTYVLHSDLGFSFSVVFLYK